jgi:hypothetical protein
MQKIWKRLRELYNSNQRTEIYSSIEMLIEKTALERGISLNETDFEFRKLNQKITDKYVEGVYIIAVRYLHEVPDAQEIPIVHFTYEELFKKKSADPEEQQG